MDGRGKREEEVGVGSIPAVCLACLPSKAAGDKPVAWPWLEISCGMIIGCVGVVAGP